MPASFPELRVAPQFWKRLFFYKEAQNQQAGQLVSCKRTAGPQFWKVLLNSGKMTPPLKTTLFEGVRINFVQEKMTKISQIWSWQLLKENTAVYRGSPLGAQSPLNPDQQRDGYSKVLGSCQTALSECLSYP